MVGVFHTTISVYIFISLLISNVYCSLWTGGNEKMGCGNGVGMGTALRGAGWVREELLRVQYGWGNKFVYAGWEWECIRLPAQVSTLHECFGVDQTGSYRLICLPRLRWIGCNRLRYTLAALLISVFNESSLPGNIIRSRTSLSSFRER